jgi:hypothetical protein
LSREQEQPQFPACKHFDRTDPQAVALLPKLAVAGKSVAQIEQFVLSENRQVLMAGEIQNSSANLSYDTSDLLGIGGLPRYIIQSVHSGMANAPL